MESTMTLADMQAIADLTAKALGLVDRPRVVLKSIRRGTARWKRGYFTIPEWTKIFGDDYVTYYVVHEVCHFWNGGIYHGPLFREVEDKALAYWGLYIKRKKVYPVNRHVAKGPMQPINI